MLKGGQLRSYQLEGLRWMVSLHDHGLNGILADEMVRCSMCSCRPCDFHGVFLLQGVHQPISHCSYYLCLHQGLGKTIQIIALIAFLVETRGIAGPYLVVAPSSVIPNWDSEFQQWAPALKVVAFRGTAQERLRIATTQVWSAPVLGLAFLACDAAVACNLSCRGRPSCCADARQLQCGPDNIRGADGRGLALPQQDPLAPSHCG
jgi:hypothetical protein